RIGTNSSGSTSVGNQGDGVAINAAANNTVGTAPAPVPAGCTAPATACSTPCNILANNNNGVNAFGATTRAAALGNSIGVLSTGTTPLGNRADGVAISNSSTNTVAGNVISGNDSGIEISGDAATQNVVRGNFIGTSSSGTSSLPNASFGVRLLTNAS